MANISGGPPSRRDPFEILEAQIQHELEQSSSDSHQQSCHHCGRNELSLGPGKTLRPCEYCTRALYCGEYCELAGWPSHQQWCRLRGDWDTLVPPASRQSGRSNSQTDLDPPLQSAHPDVRFDSRLSPSTTKWSYGLKEDTRVPSQSASPSKSFSPIPEGDTDLKPFYPPFQLDADVPFGPCLSSSSNRIPQGPEMLIKMEPAGSAPDRFTPTLEPPVADSPSPTALGDVASLRVEREGQAKKGVPSDNEVSLGDSCSEDELHVDWARTLLGAGVEGKGQAKKRVLSDDEVSLGDSCSEDEFHVDWARALLGGAGGEGHLPTTILRIQHLPEATRASAFAKLFAGSLRAATGVELVSVLNAQHAIWLRLRNAEEGKMARAFFCRQDQLGWDPSLEISFEREETLSDAQRYSSEVWYPEVTREASDTAGVVTPDVKESPLITALAPPTPPPHLQQMSHDPFSSHKSSSSRDGVLDDFLLPKAHTPRSMEGSWEGHQSREHAGNWDQDYYEEFSSSATSYSHGRGRSISPARSGAWPYPPDLWTSLEEEKTSIIPPFHSRPFIGGFDPFDLGQALNKFEANHDEVGRRRSRKKIKRSRGE